MAGSSRRSANSLGATGTAGVLAPLAESKLGAPIHRDTTLPRPRVEHSLEGGAGLVLTIVSAPPGYGKTTAVRAWLANRGTTPVWVTLDAGDNDPARLWRYIATAVDRVRHGLGRAALQRLRIPGTTVEAAIDELANALAAFDTEVVLVLDDLHTVGDPECHASLDHFVERLPSVARLVVITRSDPPLKLARLRSRGAVNELRSSELAFTSAEAHDLLVDREGLGLDAAAVEALQAKTEGWPAAIVLAAIWLRSVSDPARTILEFRGDQRFVAEYLAEEVLDALDDDARDFLLRASVMGRITAAFCNEVLDRSNSARLLAELERTLLFVTRLELGGWYRIHPLLAEFARVRLEAEEPGATGEIHRRAGEWLYAHGLPVEAAEHAATAGQFDLAARLLAEHHLVLIRIGGARTLLRWVREIPDDQLLEYPELVVGAAAATTMLGRSTIERRRFLGIVDRSRNAFPDRHGPYVEAVAGMVRAATVDGDVDTAVRIGRHAVEVASVGADDALVAALGGYARALYFAGELDEAWAAALQAVEHPHAERRPPGHAFARSTLALVAAAQGRPAAARIHAEKAREILGGIGSRRTWLGANASAALGIVLAAEGDLPAAERELASAEPVFADEVATLHHVWVLLHLARVRVRRGRLDEAQAALDASREAMVELPPCSLVAQLGSSVGRELADAHERADSGELLRRPTDAELAVLVLLTSEMSVRAIGERLYLSPNTIRSHTRSLYRKLGVNTRTDAVARANALGLLEQARSSM